MNPKKFLGSFENHVFMLDCDCDCDISGEEYHWYPDLYFTLSVNQSVMHTGPEGGAK